MLVLFSVQMHIILFILAFASKSKLLVQNMIDVWCNETSHLPFALYPELFSQFKNSSITIKPPGPLHTLYVQGKVLHLK